MEIVNPADEPLTTLEETVLLVLARGEYMAPIGRYGDVLERLTKLGLAEHKDAANYAVTARGRQVAEAKDDQFVRSWINDSNRAALSRRGLPAAMRTVGDDYAKMQDGSAQTGDYDRLTGSPVNDVFIEADKVERKLRVGPYVIEGKLFFGFEDGSAVICSRIGEPYASQIVDLWKRR